MATPNLKRRRATTIVTFPQGVLLVRQHNGRHFMLPGGGIEPGELDIIGAIRELQEETTLIARAARFLFEYESDSNMHQVFALEASGTATPNQEIAELTYYQPGRDIPLVPSASAILARYYEARPFGQP
jgi:8-oxo-dGTP pyrophosphatase MutT (NUDIX family)